MNWSGFILIVLSTINLQFCPWDSPGKNTGVFFSFSRGSSWSPDPQSMGSQRVGHEWATNTHTHTQSSVLGSVCSHFSETGSQNCARWSSSCHGYSLVMMLLTSSTWWEFQYLQKSSKDMAQNTIYSPWGGTKRSPWLCLMATRLLFCLISLLFFVFAFSHFSNWIYSLVKVFLQTRGRYGGHGRGGICTRKAP